MKIGFIQYFYVLYHAGTALNVRHFRENSECGAIEELPPIDSNPSYDFDYQVNNLSHICSCGVQL